MESLRWELSKTFHIYLALFLSNVCAMDYFQPPSSLRVSDNWYEVQRGEYFVSALSNVHEATLIYMQSAPQAQPWSTYAGWLQYTVDTQVAKRYIFNFTPGLSHLAF